MFGFNKPKVIYIPEGKWSKQLFRLGATDKDFEEAKNKSKSDNDIIWNVFMILKSRLLRQQSDISYLSFLSSLFLYEDHREEFKMSLRLQKECKLRDDKKYSNSNKVEISCVSRACEECNKDNKKIYHLLPHEKCTCKINEKDLPGWCLCEYNLVH